MSQGPEDSKAWQEKETAVGAVVTVCVVCKKDIRFWHCDERGCPWCVKCGTNVTLDKKAG